MAFPATHVRAMSQEATLLLENRRSCGVWTRAPKRVGNFRFRIVNNTKECFGPCLILFDKPPPDCVPWQQLHPALVHSDGNVHLCVSKGTAVPIIHVKGRAPVAMPPRARNDSLFRESSASSTSSSPVSSRAPSPGPPPAVCKVLVPSALMQLANKAVPPVPAPRPKPRVRVCSSARAQRNRESAATSRERKRKYISELEHQVNALERTVDTLREENWFWKSLGVQTYDATCPLVACEGFVFDSCELPACG